MNKRNICLLLLLVILIILIIPLIVTESFEEPPKIVDGFIFYNELDLLNYRLNMLDDYVDYFVIVESTHTFSGKPKPLFFNDNKSQFRELQDKIIHIIVDDFPYKYPNIDTNKKQQWDNEYWQRNAIGRGIEMIPLKDNDIIIITDLDEIPNPNILNQVNIDKIYSMEMDWYWYNLRSYLGKWNDRAKILPFKEYKKLTDIESIRTKSFPTIKNAGWHLAYFGDADFVKNKIKNFAHQEHNNEKVLEKVEDSIKNQLDPQLGRKITNIELKDNKNLPPQYNKYLTKYL